MVEDHTNTPGEEQSTGKDSTEGLGPWEKWGNAELLSFLGFYRKRFIAPQWASIYFQQAFFLHYYSFSNSDGNLEVTACQFFFFTNILDVNVLIWNHCINYKRVGVEEVSRVLRMLTSLKNCAKWTALTVQMGCLSLWVPERHEGGTGS